jgi:hypothetical protein
VREGHGGTDLQEMIEQRLPPQGRRQRVARHGRRACLRDQRRQRLSLHQLHHIG